MPPANKEKAFTCASVNYKIEELYDSLRLFQPQKPKIETLDRLEIEVSRRKLYQPWGLLFISGSCKGELSKLVFLGYLRSFMWSFSRIVRGNDFESTGIVGVFKGWVSVCHHYEDGLCFQRVGFTQFAITVANV